MIQFENYKYNIITRDQINIGEINKAASYNSDVRFLKKQKKEEKEDGGKQSLAAAIVGVNNTAAPLPLDSDYINTWTDIDSLELFLHSKPTCYLILGKPGAGAYILGEALSKKYNCIHLCPKNILDEEIERKSSTGNCLHFNLKNSKAITFEIFMKMLKIKVKSSVIQHRGYVISGFPLVSCSRNPHYFVNSLHGEESLAINNEILFDTIAKMRKQKKKKHNKTPDFSDTSLSSVDNVPGEVEEDEEEDIEEEPEPEEELGEEEQELKVVLPTFLLDSCSNVIQLTKAYYNTKKVVLLKQLDDLFSLHLKPDIVIYLSSPDKDLMVKKSHIFIDYKTQHLTIKPFPSKTHKEVRWPTKYITSDNSIPFDTQIFKSKYAVRQPMNFEYKSVSQMCNYNQDILPFLDKKLKDFEPKSVIKIDGRLSLHEMVHEISERLLEMAVKPVIKPEPLLIEEVPEELEEFWKMTKELNVIHSGAVSFYRHASPWFNRCPVELKKRISKKGNPKLAIAFMRYIFLTATLDNLISFYKNPRPYLKLKYLEPTCRVIVIGTKLSGKTMISECLSWLFDTPVINFNKILQKEVERKYNSYARRILSEIIATIEDDRLAKWQNSGLSNFSNKPTLPVLGDEDVTLAIAAYIEANDLQKEINPSTEEMTNLIISMISSIDERQRENTNMDEMYGKYIIDDFPSDIDYWNALAELNLLPDYTVTLIENREIDPEILKHYKHISNCMKHHHGRYISANDPLIKTKLKLQPPPEAQNLDMNIFVQEFINDFNNLDEVDAVDSNPETEPWLSFSEKVEKFKEDWDSIKNKLEEHDKCFIELQLENKTDIEVIEEVMLKLRKCYYLSCEDNEDEDLNEQEEEDGNNKDIAMYNSTSNFGETGMYCPIAYYKYNVLWEGKPEFSVKFDNKLYRLCKEENVETFQKDVTRYQSYNKPFKTLPPLRICVIGGIGSGKSTISKLIAKELGLMYVDFSEALNEILMPKHFRKVGIKYENIFTDIPMDDEAVVDFQMDEGNENIIADIMSNETELRKMVFNYFERGTQILPQLMQKLITRLWFQEPFVNCGFVIDGYPKLTTDVEDMITCYCIPDLVIELESASDNAIARHASNMLKTWKIQVSEAKERARNKLEQEKKEWMEFLIKNIVVKLVCDEIIENVFMSSEPVNKLSVESVIIDANPSGTIVDPNLFNTFNEMIQQFPEPVDQSQWEKSDDVRERIEARLEGIFQSDDENIQSVKDILEEQRIKLVSIDGSKSLTKVNRLALSKLTNLRNRNESFFEETLVISPDIAEMLLSDGLRILSNKFNRICPVYIYENPHVIQSIYSLSKCKNAVFPVVHRSYIYFIYGKANLIKFRKNPLKYVTDNKICDFTRYSLKIAVIGPPKSGKSTLSAKLAKRYGLICLSRGIASRNVLEHKLWTELGTKMSISLRKGECVDTDDIMNAVQITAMDHRSVTHGFVFDGFPETASEAMALVKDGIYPDIILDITAEVGYVLENSKKEIYYDIIKRVPPYSRPFIENRYSKSQEHTYNLRDWINSDYQNLYKIDGNYSKWKCLEQAVNIINNFMAKVNNYFKKVKTDVVPVDYFCISNEEFERRMSHYKHICPLCFQTRHLRHNWNPIIKKGVVQYEDKFYWICPDHIDAAMKNPLYLKSGKLDKLPELPVIIKKVNMNLIYERGVCIVTYAEHLPMQMLVVGTAKYAVSYRGHRYLFCSKICHEKFLEKPELYYDITVFRDATVSKPLTLKGLPSIGYLEQTVGIVITEACVSVTVHRPKYPGLTFKLSALLHIALYLKTHNSKMREDELKMYKKISKIFNAKCKIIQNVGLLLRSMDNPFAVYPKCCGHVESESEILTKPSSQTFYSKLF